MLFFDIYWISLIKTWSLMLKAIIFWKLLTYELSKVLTSFHLLFRNFFSISLRSRSKLSLTSAKRSIYIRILYVDFIIIDTAKSLRFCVFLSLLKTLILNSFISARYFFDISIVQLMKNNCVNFFNIRFQNWFVFFRCSVKGRTAKLMSLIMLFFFFSSSSFFLIKNKYFFSRAIICSVVNLLNYDWLNFNCDHQDLWNNVIYEVISFNV